MEKKTIQCLLIDDDTNLSATVKELINEECYDPSLPQIIIDTAYTDQEALDKIKAKRYEIALLDVFLDGSLKNGDELLPDIKKIAPYMPVIMLTSDASLHRARKSFQNGAYSYFIKDDITNPGKKDIDHLITNIINAVKLSKLQYINHTLKLLIKHSIKNSTKKIVSKLSELSIPEHEIEGIKKELKREILLLDSFSNIIDIMNNRGIIQKQTISISEILAEISSEQQVEIAINSDEEILTDPKYVKQIFRFIITALTEIGKEISTSVSEDNDNLFIKISAKISQDDEDTDDESFSIQDEILAIILNTKSLIESLNGQFKMEQPESLSEPINVLITLPKK